MKLKKYVIGILAILLVTAISCDSDELSNPTLADQDLTVYFWGEGDNIKGIAWDGYDVLIGESLDLRLQVSPAEDTEVKWVDDATGEVVSTSLEYTYAPTEEESRRINFIATRPSGYEVIIPFNFRGALDGFSSVINQWQSFLIPNGTQTGAFTFEFDVIPSKDIIDGVVGILDGIATTYSNNSAIFRFNGAGKIDAYNTSGYAAENDLTYHGGVTYHVRMEVDATTMMYDVFVTEAGGSEVVIAQDYGFRRQITHLNYWSMVAGNFNIADPGTHRVFNVVFTTHTQNEAPVFIAVSDMLMPEGQSLEVEIEAIDPLGGNIQLEAMNLPRFATFVDNGFGRGVVTFNPYDNCGGCDLGIYDIHIVATNSSESTDLNFNLEVLDPFAAFDVPVDLADATIWGNGAVDPNWTQLFGGHVNAGIGGDDHVVGVMPFALPDVPVGKKVKSAVLTVNVTANNSWVAVEFDVYAIASRGLAEVLPSDFYVGAYDADVNATAIQQGLIVNGAGTGEFVMDAPSGINLADYMNAEYAGGAVMGDFMFVRINSNRGDMPTWAHLQFDSGQVAATAPVLTVTLEDI